MSAESHLVLMGLISFCALLLLLSIVRQYAHRSVIPPDAWVLLAGIFYGVGLKKFDIQSLPTFELSPDVIILIFLPLLIFASGRFINLQALKSEAAPISFFAIVGVLFTSFAIGAPVAWALDIPLLHGLLIGAAAGATDPAAVAAIFHSFDIPTRLGLIVEGESLFNDGTTVVLFGLVVSLVIGSESFSFYQSLGTFVWAIIIALPLGAACGYVGAKVLLYWQQKNVFLEVSMTFIISYAAFLIAEELLHVSGVIAVLMAAVLFVKTYHATEAREEKERVNRRILSEFWDYTSIVINGILFFSLGAATGLHDFSEVPTIAMVAALGSLVLSRLVLVYGGSALLRLFNIRLALTWQHILVFGGLRGAVSAALILMIPHDYPHRGVFLCLAFAMIAFTLIVQPVLMKMYLQRNEIVE
ncbi:MAG: CPA1 family monovalent cation:H+ antiporter [Candidatus Endobugula sp.]|jgi:CPA1 family monovalent cation:H+ antiporter